MTINAIRFGSSNRAKAITVFLALAAAILLLSGCGNFPSGGEGDDEFAPTAEGATFFNNPRAIGEEPDGNLVVADFSSGHIVRVDRTTGERFLLSDNDDPSLGPAFVQPAGIAILPDGRIFIADLVLNLSLIHI